MAAAVFNLAGALLVLVLVHLVNNYFAAGVRKVPGPFLAKLTNLFRTYDVSKGANHASLIAYHEKYGDNVRLGPRVVSIRNQADLNQVYSVRNGLPKVVEIVSPSLSQFY
jgi:hypothetical protein